MKARGIKSSIVGLAVVVASIGAMAVPAHAAVAGSGTSITLDKSGRAVTGYGNYVVEPSANSNFITVEYECHAVAAPDPSQTRVLPVSSTPSESGCVLYKGGTAVGQANGQSLPGAAAAVQNSASVDLRIPGAFQLCWRVAATFLANGGEELYNSGCTDINS
jgi:hypothetical protein